LNRKRGRKGGQWRRKWRADDLPRGRWSCTERADAHVGTR